MRIVHLLLCTPYVHVESRALCVRILVRAQVLPHTQPGDGAGMQHGTGRDPGVTNHARHAAVKLVGGTSSRMHAP